MGTLSLNAATSQLHQAMDDYRAAFDASTTVDAVSARDRTETALVLLQGAMEQWGTERGFNLLSASERFLKFALGAENDG